MRHYIPSTTFSIPIDTTKILQQFEPKELNASYTNSITWNHPKKFYGLNEIVLMNIGPSGKLRIARNPLG